MVRKGLPRLSPCPASSEGRVLASPPHSPVGRLPLSGEESEALAGPGLTCLGLQNFDSQAAPPLASTQHHRVGEAVLLPATQEHPSISARA